MPSQVVICGSMSHYDDMLKCWTELRAAGIPCIMPEPDEADVLNVRDKFLEFKREIARQYLSEIAKADTFAILVVNKPKRGICHYIGANSFAEIAVAFYARKQIYLLEGIYENFEEELSAWQACALQGNLNQLISEYQQTQGGNSPHESVMRSHDYVYAGA